MPFNAPIAAVAGLCVALILAPAAHAQGTAQPAAAERIDTAPVAIDGETLFRLRGITSYPAAQRAAAVAARIRAIAQDGSVPPTALSVVEAEDRSNIVAGTRPVVSVIDLDARLEDTENRQVLAVVYRDAIARAVERHRQERSADYLRAQGVHAAIALGLMVALLFALRWVFRWSANALERRVQSRLKELEAKSYRLLSAGELANALQGGLRTLHFLLAFALVFAGICYCLSLFPWTRAFARRSADLILDPLATMWTGLVDALPGLVFIAILAVITAYVLKLVRLFFAGIARGTIRPKGFDQDWSWPTYRLLRFAILAFAVVLAYPYIPGSSTEAFKGISIFLGLLMSLGAASMVANSLAGYALIYRRAFRVGDRIKVGEVTGDVVEMRQQVTHLRTPKNEEVTIPSATILGSHVVNYSSLARDHGLILHTTIGIGYETPWRQVEAMLIEAANRTQGLLRTPPPFVMQKSLGDFCITYELNVHTDQPQQMNALYSALHRSILDVFNEYGVQIMTPAYEGDPEKPKVVAKADWFAPPATK